MRPHTVGLIAALGLLLSGGCQSSPNLVGVWTSSTEKSNAVFEMSSTFRADGTFSERIEIKGSEHFVVWNQKGRWLLTRDRLKMAYDAMEFVPGDNAALSQEVAIRLHSQQPDLLKTANSNGLRQVVWISSNEFKAKAADEEIIYRRK
jgi:hypothetical protein